eukprot:626784-Amphidinium_carterae.1
MHKKKKSNTDNIINIDIVNNVHCIINNNSNNNDNSNKYAKEAKFWSVQILTTMITIVVKLSKI